MTIPAAAPLHVGAAGQVDEARLQGWVARIVDQDQAAFAALYEALVSRVYGLALRISRQPQQAEEIAEDVFWQIWRQAPRFDRQRGNVMAWVMTMTRSRALDALRRDDTPEVQDDDALARAADEADTAAPFDLLAAVDERHHLHAALARLEPLPRQLLALAFFRGLTHDEIASHSGLALGTVKSHIRRALVRLREQLSAAGLSGSLSG